MQEIIKSLEDQIRKTAISEEERSILLSGIKKLNKEGAKLEFKLNSIVDKGNTTKNLLSNIINELEEKKEYINKANEELEKQKNEISIFADELQERNNLLIEKNHEIEQQTEEIRAIANNLQEALDHITLHKKEIEKNHQEIKDSISYAGIIQKALLPTKEDFDRLFRDHFVYWKPRDIVSGDFYWLKEVNNCTIIAVADCTGHGVPGAFVSMLGISFLNEIALRNEFRSAAGILEELRNYVKNALTPSSRQYFNFEQRSYSAKFINELSNTSHSFENEKNRPISYFSEVKDGMDISLCIIDFEKKQMQYAGAYNPIYLIREKGNDKPSCEYEFIEFRANRQPIGFHIKEDSFTNHLINLHEGDSVYMFTDGYIDQIGGSKRKKFLKKHFKELLLSIQSESMQKQEEILNTTLNNWKTDSYPQIDDILVAGFIF